ncbi:hypothetical protein [Paenibacillus sp. BC26]|uniref:hypothetical protein n=1 Tax=Paenibacillus sp. BC26 TaxID=1881032 RepID=UPI0008E551EF|nr:hypothetical protein [Paenibacillus sp. BC26]SFT29326.1 hypothetical protein SAMN05428962_0064 [Paenibacillus sp. BC26]
MKYTDKSSADVGSFEPLLVGPEQLVLTSLQLGSISPGDRLVLRFEVGWENPDIANWDSGEMEILLREDGPDGLVVYWNLESCFMKGRTKEQLTFVGTDPQRRYYLTVRSNDTRARITGPYSLQGSVYAP